MHDSMQKITRVAGVLGAAIFDDSGACLAQDLTPPYEPILLAEISTQLRDVYDNYLALAESDSISSLVATFDEGYLLVRNFSRRTLMVIASTQTNLAMLAVSINVAMLKLGRAPAPAQAGMGAQSVSPVHQSYPPQPPPYPGMSSSSPGLHRRDTMPIEPPAAAGGGYAARGSAPSNSVLHNSSVGSSVNRAVGSSLSISWTDEGQGGKRPPPDAVGLSVMRHVLKALARRIGAVDARAILDEELRMIGESPATVRAGQFTDIIHSVAARMPNAAERSAFIADALGDAGF
ncbi:MAG: hypothetical protein Tsb0020_18360 [Haliangiales bacterium]